MPKTKISEFSATPANNTDIDSINIAEGCAPSGINDAIRELMAQLKDWQAGTSNDPMVIGSSGSLTLNQGTANGVAYLNGSKVVTSGSGLVFDGANLGVGVSPSVPLHVTKNGADSGFGFYVISKILDASTNKGLQIGYDNSTQTTVLVANTSTAVAASTSMSFWTWRASGDGWAERMRVDSLGNLGVGTSSPSAKIDAQGTAAAAYVGQILTNNSSTGYTQHGFNIGPSGANGKAGIFYAPSLFYKFGVVANDTSTPITFVNNNDTERARIDSSGNLLVGTTSSVGSAGRIEAVQSGAGAAGAAISADATSATFAYSIAYLNSTRAASSAFNFINCTSSAYVNPQFRVTGDGVIYAANTTVQALSDQRLKENIRNASEGLNVITALRPVRYDWKEGYGNDRKNQLGFLAQEVEQVFPEAVSEWKGDKDSTAYKTVGPAALIPVLVKAIQEQQAIIESLTTRITALEGQ